MNLAGKPAKLGGTVASVFGWGLLAATFAVALILGAIFGAIFTPAVGWLVGGGLSVFGGALAVMLLMGGSFLRKTGDKAAHDVRREAVFALAQNQRGILRAPVVGQALGVSPAEAEAILTGLSRDPDSGITLEVDQDGKLYYRVFEIAARFPGQIPGGLSPLPQAPDGARVRVQNQKTELQDAPQDAPVDEALEPEAPPVRTKRAF